MMGPKRSQSTMGPPGEDGPPFDMGPPGGWGPRPPVGHLPPEDWGPPPPGGWGPLPPEGWPPMPPDGWDPRGPPPPDGWGPPPPGGWGPLPPRGWGSRGPAPPDWVPRGPPPPGWGGHPDDWLRPPDDWAPPHPDDWRPRHPDDWRLAHPDEWKLRHPESWRMYPRNWSPPPEGPPEPWGSEILPPGPLPPDAAAYAPAVPPPGIPPPGIPPPCIPPPGIPPPGILPPGIPPSVGFGGYPTVWTGELVVEEVLPNPPPDQPEWIKALISAPPTESAQSETKKMEEPVTTPAAQPPTIAPRPKPANKASNTKALGLLAKRTFEKPPPGRSTGIISFIGPNFGYIEREDLEKYTFSFDVFFGNPKAMTPGVRVHFTACKEKGSLIATDVKVAPGGTENVDPEIYEAVVSQPIVEPQPGERQYPGQVHVTIGQLRTNLTFDTKDSAVTLLKNDQVLINLLTDIVTEKKRATNIKPKIPSTFSETQEIREQGVIISLKDGEGVIKSEKHGELPFDIKENFSDVEFTAEDVNEEVEFTVITLRAGNRAIRIKRVKEPLLLTICSAAAASASKKDDGQDVDVSVQKIQNSIKAEVGPNMKLDSELYEGVVTQTIIEPSAELPGYPGQIHANIGPVKTNVTFDHRDCGITLLKNDHVLINLLYNVTTGKKRATNIKPKVPFTFSYTKEIRELGIISCLSDDEGVISTADHGELSFNTCENFSDTEFSSEDIHKEVEFTLALENGKKRAIRLMRTKRDKDPILEEQKKREEEEKRKKKEEAESKRKEEEQLRETERKRKEEAAAALEAAKCKWTPLGFKVRDPDTLEEISKERFEGTVLKAISRITKIKKELPAEQEAAKNGQTPLTQIQIKVEKTEEDEKEGKAVEEEEKKDRVQVKIEKEEEDKHLPDAIAAGGAKAELGMGRLVMTVDGQQKQLPFCPNDLLSSATMFDGDRVRFNIATHPETKAERATYVEILPESFQESNEQRQHGIVIEFSENSGLIKCSQNPQLYFHMSEVLEKKKLELNEKVDFSLAAHETAEAGIQAIRIKRYSESVFLPVRKLGGVGASKGKMTIKLSKALEDTEKVKQDAEKLKAVVKSLRTRDSKTSSYKRNYSLTRHRRSRSRSRSRSRARSRSKSRSPTRDEFGRTLKKRRSSSIDRDDKSSRHRPSRDRSYRHSKSRSRSRSRSRDRSRDRSRSRDRANKKRSRVGREPEDSHRRRKETSPPPRRAGVVEDELAQKKRELEELNEMIAYKKALVERDPGHRTCIDYDHGRIAVPLAEYRPVRSIMKKRPEAPEYLRHPARLYEDAYYDRPYGPYHERLYGDRYGDPYRSHPYSDRHPYTDRFYEPLPYGEGVYSDRAPTSTRYTDRYDVYDQPSEDRYYDSPYDPYRSGQSPQSSLPPPQSGDALAGSAQPHGSHSASESSSHHPYRPPSPTDPPPRSPSPQLAHLKPRQSPPADKPPPQKPLDRFLDMLNKKVDAEKKSEPVYGSDDLLPHERALHDGKGFSRIVGMAQELSGGGGVMVDVEKHPSPEQPSTSPESKSQAEPYEKIQSLLRTIGLKLSTGDVSKLASRAQEKIYSPKASSAERDMSASSRAERHAGRTGSFGSEATHSPSPARASSVEPRGRHEAVSEYEDFLDQKELESLKKAQMLQSLTKTMGTSPSAASALRPPGPPPPHYQHPTPPANFPLGTMSQSLGPGSTAFGGGSAGAGQAAQQFGPGAGPSTELPPPQPGQYPSGAPPWRPSGQTPPGPPPGPPPRRPAGQPPFPPPSAQAGLPFIDQPRPAPHLQPDSPAAERSPSGDEQSAISTTVARCLKVIETVKNLSTQPPPRTGKSVQFSLPTEPSSSSPQSSADTDEEIKTKQKEKLDVYNQRLLEKREQQYQELLARKKAEKNKDSTMTPPGKPVSSEPKNVWICGHSLVYWAESRARSPEVGMQLGMDPSKVSIWWKGTQGMTWPQLLPQLHQLKVTWPNPDVLIVHLGGNDLSTDSPTDLLASVKKDLTSVRSIFPQCVLVWSNILPRRVWRHSSDSHEVDLVRTTVNRRIQTIVSDLGGVSLTHDNIRCGTNTGQYRADGVHLSHKGIDLFNLNLQDFLEKWEMSSEKS